MIVGRKHIVLTGPLSVGKSYFVKQLKSLYNEALGAIEMGHMVRERLRTDESFMKMYGSVVRRGDLIHDKEALAMASVRYRELKAEPAHRLFCWDGVPRNGNQADYQLKQGLFTKDNTLVINLVASSNTCWKRFEHRQQLKPDGPRPEGPESFNHRFALSEKDIPALLEAFRAHGIMPVTLIANRELSEIAPGLIALAKAHCGVKPDAVVAKYESPMESLSPRERFVRLGLLPAASLSQAMTPPTVAQLT